EPIKIGEVILFKDGNVVYVERIISKSDDQYTVDIDKYPSMAQPGAMKKTISRDEIYGVYSHRNRWLGALILFSNTVFGRLLFLLLPAFILFFYKPIKQFFEMNAKGYFEEE
ncbi:MAG: S26 family signal peptidase, partial [Clostridiales bacterium]|nr:S26 family signal peptidase [Clostridiales bacterium]